MPRSVIIKLENSKSSITEFGSERAPQTQHRIINFWIDRPIEYYYFLCLINVMVWLFLLVFQY